MSYPYSDAVPADWAFQEQRMLPFEEIIAARPQAYAHLQQDLEEAEEEPKPAPRRTRKVF